MYRSICKKVCSSWLFHVCYLGGIFIIKKYLSITIFLSALGLGILVIINNQNESVDENTQRLNEYIESGGIESEMQNAEFEDFENSNETGIDPGMMAPDFQLPTLEEGRDFTLSDLRGNYVILNMWATWCAPCRDEMPDFVDFYEDYQGDNVEIVAVNMSTTERNMDNVEQFVEDFQIPFYTVLDEAGKVENDYVISVMPNTYIIDPDGRVVFKRLGFINYDMLEEYYLDVKENYESNQASAH